jgi:serine/threonine protein phosphatase PrpC
MVVTTSLPYFSITGNEVAEWVRDHLIDFLKNLDSFKQKNYEQALTDIYVNIDVALQNDPEVKRKL